MSAHTFSESLHLNTRADTAVAQGATRRATIVRRDANRTLARRGAEQHGGNPRAHGARPHVGNARSCALVTQRRPRNLERIGPSSGEVPRPNPVTSGVTRAASSSTDGASGATPRAPGGVGSRPRARKSPGTAVAWEVGSRAAPTPAAPVAALDEDGDGDGVRDRYDNCPHTLRGVEVNANGCWEFKGLRFDFDEIVIKDPASLDEAIGIMRARPELTGEIRGYTDAVGTSKYNQKLSKARANTVREYFIQHGIAASRVRAVGFGMNDPVASNETDEGRALNRRVELEPDR